MGVAGETVPKPMAPRLFGYSREYRNKAGDVSSVPAWDDLTNLKAEAGEFVESMRVYDEIPRGQAIRNVWGILTTRRIDINKGDEENPSYRSRLVGEEFIKEQMG